MIVDVELREACYSSDVEEVIVISINVVGCPLKIDKFLRYYNHISRV